MSKEKATIRLFNPPALAAPVGYSHVAEIRGGRMLYISGQVALDAAGNLVGEGDFVAQTEQVFANLNAALEAAGTDFGSVFKLNVYVLDMVNLLIVREIRNRYVNEDVPPASTAVEVKRLFREEFLIEVEAVAVVGD